MRFLCILISFFLFSSSVVYAETASSTLSFDIDTDKDGLSDIRELNIYHTDLAKSDTDGDGHDDGEEVKNGYSPLFAKKKIDQVDTDKDGLNDKLEIALGTDLTNPDTDGDRFKDGEEVNKGFNPLKGDRDRSLSRHAEVNLNKQTLAYFLNGVKIGEVPVSTGVLRTKTPNGEFYIMNKKPVVNYTGVNYSYPKTKWNLEFKSSYYIHGAYWHNQFGKKPMSHGCVNVAYINAEKLYNFFDVGDLVKINGATPVRVAGK